MAGSSALVIRRWTAVFKSALILLPWIWRCSPHFLSRNTQWITLSLTKSLGKTLRKVTEEFVELVTIRKLPEEKQKHSSLHSVRLRQPYGNSNKPRVRLFDSPIIHRAVKFHSFLLLPRQVLISEHTPNTPNPWCISASPGSAWHWEREKISWGPDLLWFVLSTKPVLFYLCLNWKLRKTAFQMAGFAVVSHKYIHETETETNKMQLKQAPEHTTPLPALMDNRLDNSKITC